MRMLPALLVKAALILILFVVASPTLAATPRVMPLGASITYGLTSTGYNSSTGKYEYADAPGGYRTSFYETMTAADLGFQFVGSSTENPSDILSDAGQTAHEGHGGWTIGDDVYSAMNNFVFHITDWMQTYRPDVILFHGGTNDLLLGAGVEKTTTNMTILLDKIYAADPNVKVFMAGIVPITRSDSINAQVVSFNQSLASLTSSYSNLYYVDQYANFTTPTGQADPTHLPDNIHPDAYGYNLIGTTFANAVIANAAADFPPVTHDTATHKIAVDITATGAANSLFGITADNSANITYNKMRGTGSLANLSYTDGESSNFSITFVSGSIASINSNAAGLTAGEVAAAFPDAAARDFIGTTSKTDPIIFRIDGLDDSATYTFDIFSSRTATGTRNCLFIADGLNSVSGEIDCINNYDTFLTLANLQPINGSITITCMPGSGNTGYAYFNALQITEVISTPEPASLSLLALGSLTLLRRRNR